MDLEYLHEQKRVHESSDPEKMRSAPRSSQKLGPRGGQKGGRKEDLHLENRTKDTLILSSLSSLQSVLLQSPATVGRCSTFTPPLS